MHSYHANCGCFTCEKEEALTERRNEAIADALPALIALPSFVSEALGENPMSWEAEVTAALASGDDAQAGRILRREVAEHLAREVERLQDACRCEVDEAVKSLLYTHTPVAASLQMRGAA